MTTINKLLKKQTTKKRGKAMNPETLAAAEASAGTEAPSGAEDEEIEVAGAEPVEVTKANPLFVRWVSSSREGVEGFRIGVPEEWLGKKNVAGGLFAGMKPTEG